MKESVRRFALFVKSALFTIVIHGILLAALLVGLWWPFSEEKFERGSVQPIQAKAISMEEIQQQVDVQEDKIEEQKAIAENLEELKVKQEEEKKKLEELEVKKQEEEKKQEELKIQNKLAEEKKLEEEKKKKLEEEKKRKEDEKKKKLEEEKKRIEAEKKKAADEKRKREAALKEQLEAEQTASEAANAMYSLKDRIRAAIERNWIRPSSSIVGLQATIRVRLSQGGDVLSANVVKSSGNQFFDRSAEVAVNKASPLPFPANPKYYKFINELDLEFNPDDY